MGCKQSTSRSGTTTPSAHSPVIHKGLTEEACCTHVESGDTICLDSGTRVKLLGIYAPSGEEELATQAKDFLRRTCARRVVHMDYDGEREDEDGRRVAYVLMKGFHGMVDVSLNGEVLRHGFGRWHPPVPGMRLRQAPYFRRCMEEGMKGKRGIWARWASRGQVDLLNDGEYHLPKCKEVTNFPDMQLFHLDEDEALIQGMIPCEHCVLPVTPNSNITIVAAGDQLSSVKGHDAVSG